jgi:Tol biopolymer transport system component
MVADPSLLKVIDFTPKPSYVEGTGHPISMLGLWGTTIENLVWSTDGAPSDAVFPIVYVNFVTNDLYATYPRKNVTVRMTNGTADQERLPAWNKNETYLTYTANNHIYKIRANGSGKVQLTNRANLDNGRQEWSPDGTKIVFSDSDAGGNAKDIWVMNADGTGLTNLTGGVGQNQHPTWQSDGRQIVWSRNTGAGFHLWMMFPDGSAKRQVTSFAGQQEIQPCEGPEGGSVVYTKVVGTDLQIARTDMRGSQQVLTTQGHNQWPSVSPGGEWIAYQSDQTGDLDVWVMRTDGNEANDVTQAAGNQGMPSWKTVGFYHAAIGAAGVDAGFNPPLGTSAQAALATAGSGESGGDDGDSEAAYFASYSINAASAAAVTLNKVEGESVLGLIDVMTTSSLVIKEDLFRGATPRNILGGTGPLIPGTIQRALLLFEGSSGLCVGALSFAGGVTPVQLGPAPKPYSVSQAGGNTVIRGDSAGLWTAAGGYRSGVSQVTIDAKGRITAG